MPNFQRLPKKLFASFITVLASFIVPEIAMSNPVFINPSKEYQEADYIINGGG